MLFLSVPQPPNGVGLHPEYVSLVKFDDSAFSPDERKRTCWHIVQSICRGRLLDFPHWQCRVVATKARRGESTVRWPLK